MRHEQLSPIGAFKNYLDLIDFPERTAYNIIKSKNNTIGVPNGTRPHVSNNSGENEWYTPPRIIDLAKNTIGQHFLPEKSRKPNQYTASSSTLTRQTPKQQASNDIDKSRETINNDIKQQGVQNYTLEEENTPKNEGNEDLESESVQNYTPPENYDTPLFLLSSLLKSIPDFYG